jgi:hypothetical protein
MFDVRLGGIQLTIFVIIFSALVLLPIQLLLCFKVRSRLIRLLPVMLLSVPVVIFAVLSYVVIGWDAIGYLFLAIFAGVMLAACGIGWGIWAIATLMKRRQSKSKNRPAL